MHTSWTWMLAALGLALLALVAGAVWRRRTRREQALQRQRQEQPAPASRAPRASVPAPALPDRRRARERAEQARQARAASALQAAQTGQTGQAGQAGQAGQMSSFGQAATTPAALDLELDLDLDLDLGGQLDLELDLDIATAATAPVPHLPLAGTAPADPPRPRLEQVADAVQAARHAPGAAPPPPPAAPPPRRVLVVDDAKTARVKIGRLLQAHGLLVSYAVDGQDALRQLALQRPDLLITDMDMPGLDGFGLTRALRCQPATADLPVLMVSAADGRHQAQAADAGVTALLGKPFGDERLLRLVQSVLAAPAGSSLPPARATQPA